MQKTTFPYEIIIHDDASTDGTVEIIKEYEKKYAELFVCIYQSENQMSQGINPMVSYVYPVARGKYIALCEGDDYWTDPYKLQKQVDFLEAHPNYSLCVGGYIELDELSKDCRKIIKQIKINDNENIEGYTFDLKDMEKDWITKALTAVFSRKAFDESNKPQYKTERDIHLFYHLLKKYKGFYFTSILGVYRIHKGGINSQNVGAVNLNIAFNCYYELYKLNKDEFTRHMYFKHALGYFNYNLFNNPINFRNNSDYNLFKLIKIYFNSLILLRRIVEIKYLITAFLPWNKLRKRKYLK